MADAILHVELDEAKQREWHAELVADWQWYADNDPANGYPEQREDPKAKPPTFEQYREDVLNVYLDELLGDHIGYRVVRGLEVKA